MLSRSRHGSAAGREAVLLLLAVLVGGALRLSWPGDIEYKSDEAWTFEQVVKARETGRIPMLGMPSSKNLLNPGLSVWVFIAIDRVYPSATPVELARAVQVCNTLALLLLAGFVWCCVPPGQREIWIWAVFLAAVNPVDVRFHRKIWPPSLFPLPLVVMLIAWWYRGRRVGSFGWGLIGVLIGQIQMGGFILTAGMTAWNFWKDRGSVRWRWWMAGAALGTLPMLNWFAYLASAPEQTPGNSFMWQYLLSFRLFTYWLTQPLGIGFKHALGNGVMEFLGEPFVGGQPTYLLLGLQGLMIAAGATILALWIRRVLRREAVKSTPTRLSMNAVLWGFGILFTVTFLPCFRHYLLVTFPFMYVWLAYLAIGNNSGTSRRISRGCLATLVAGQMILSVSFLEYVHRRGGTSEADYGVVYDSPLNSDRLRQRMPTSREAMYAARQPD